VQSSPEAGTERSGFRPDDGDGVLRRYRAEDTGGAVEGNHIDICITSHEEALALGVRQAEVWWSKGETS